MVASTIVLPSLPLTHSIKPPSSSLITWKLNHHHHHHHHHHHPHHLSRQYHHDQHSRLTLTLTLTPLFCSLNPPTPINNFTINPLYNKSKKFNCNTPLINSISQTPNISQIKDDPYNLNNNDEVIDARVSIFDTNSRTQTKNHDPYNNKGVWEVVASSLNIQKAKPKNNNYSHTSAFVKVGISVLVCGVVSLIMMWDNGTILRSHRATALAASGGRTGGRSSSSRSLSRLSSSSLSSSSSSSSNEDITDEELEDITDEELKELILTLLFIFAFGLFMEAIMYPHTRTTIFMLQIASVDEKRSIQKKINMNGKSFSMSTHDDLISLLKATTKSLLQHSDLWISASVSANVFDESDAEWCFNFLSKKEQKKFDEMTFINVNNIQLEKKEIGNGDKSCNYTMVIILVAVQGLHSKPIIQSREDLRKALEKFGSTEASEINAVEILWSPQLEDDTLTKERLLEDYPHLNLLN